MAKVLGTDGNDTLTDEATADQIEGFAGDDIIENGFGNDRIFPGTGDDQIFIYPGQGDDLLVIEPDGGHDIVRGLSRDHDSLVFSGYRVIDSYDDLAAFTSFDEETGLLTIDVSAAEGGTPGEQTLAFLNSAEFHPDIVGVNTEGFDLHAIEPVEPPVVEPPVVEPPVVEPPDPIGPIDPILDYDGQPYVVHTAKPARIEVPDPEPSIFPIPYGNDFRAIPDE